MTDPRIRIKVTATNVDTGQRRGWVHYCDYTENLPTAMEELAESIQSDLRTHPQTWTALPTPPEDS